jgi:hypothetical protein
VGTGPFTDLEGFSSLAERCAHEEVNADFEVQRLCTQSLAAFDHLRAGRWAEATAGYGASLSKLRKNRPVLNAAPTPPLLPALSSEKEA